MIKDKLIQWFKDNEHKFVFYSYRGGMGGEKIVHYLCDETDYFYNRTFEKDFFHNHPAGEETISYYTDSDKMSPLMKENDYNRTSMWQDWMFYDWFLRDSLTCGNSSHNFNDDEPFLNPIQKFEDVNFEMLYNRLYENHEEWLKLWRPNSMFGFGDPEHSWAEHLPNRHLIGSWKDIPTPLDEILNRFTQQDKPYLIRTHGISPAMAAFKNATFIEHHPDEWQKYCMIMTNMKVYMSPEKTRERKLALIDKWSWGYGAGYNEWKGDNKDKLYKPHTEEKTKERIEFIKNYIGEDFLNDESKPLYYKTIYVLGEPDIWKVPIEKFDIDSLNTMIFWTQNMFIYPELLTDYIRDMMIMWQTVPESGHSRNLDDEECIWDFWKVNRDLIDKINPIFITMQDNFTGEWVEQFGGDKEKFLLVWNKWHKDNMNMLKEYKLFDIGHVN